MPGPVKPVKTIELREILAILRKRYVIIAIVTLTALVISGLISFLMPSVYEARTIMLATQAAPVEYYRYESQAGLEGIMSSMSKLPEMTVNTYAGQLKSDAVIERVINRLKLDQKGYTVRSMAALITVEVEKDTNLIHLRVTNTDRGLAAQIANTMVSEFLEFISDTNKRQMEKSVEFLKQQESSVSEELEKAQNELNKLKARTVGEAESEKISAVQKEVDHLEELHNLLRTNIDVMQIGKSMKFGETSLSIVSPAIAPETPIKPQKGLNMLMAMAVGLLVSTGLAFLINYLDNTVKTPEQIEELFSLPVLGQIPVFKLSKTILRGVDYGQ